MNDPTARVYVAAERVGSAAFDSLLGDLGKLSKVATAVGVATAAAIAVGVERVIDSVAALGEQAIKSAGALQDQSRQLGVSAEALQEYRLVASAAGVSTEQFDKALSILNKTVGNSALGKGDFEKTLESVGLQLRDHEGRVKSVATVYGELATKVREGSLSNAQAISLMAAAFGRDGGKMVEVLRQTETQQRAVIDAAREYGAILSNEVVAAADEYGDKLELIQKGTEALKTQSELILAPLTLKWAGMKNEIAGTVAELARAAGLIDDNETLQLRRLKQMEDAIRFAREAHRVNAPDQPETEDAFLMQTIAAYSDLRRQIYETKKAAEEAKAAIAPAGGDEGDGVIVQTQKQWSDAIEAMKVDAKDFGAFTIDVWQSMPDAQRAANDQLLSQDIEVGAQRIEVWRSMENEVSKIVRAGGEERYRFAQLNARQQASTIFGEIATLTAGVAQQNKTMFELNKAAALAEAAVDFPKTVMKAYAWGTAHGGPFVGAAMAGIAAAAQLTQMNAIRSASFVGGGGGTTPSLAGSTPTVNGEPASLPSLSRDRSAVRVELHDVHFYGPGGFDQFAKLVGDAIKREANDRDVIFVTRDSAQAREIRGGS